MSDEPDTGPEPLSDANRHTRFKKGQSGNPRGRPPRKRTDQPDFDLRSTLRDALNTKATVTISGRKTEKTASEVGVLTLVAQFAKGDRHARRDVFELAQRTGIDLVGENRHLIEECLAPNHQAILDEYVARRTGKISASSVIASGELMDDL